MTSDKSNLRAKRVGPPNRRRRAVKVKKKRGALWGVGAALVGIFLLWRGELLPAKETSAATALLQSAPQALSPQSFGDADNIEGQIAPGETLQASLRARGISEKEIEHVFEALRREFDFRVTRPGDSYRLRREQKSGDVLSFSYQRSPIEVYSLALGQDHLLHRSSGEATNGETTQITLSLERSLRDVLQSREDGEALSRLITSALSWQLDVNRISEGELTLLIEKSSNKAQPYQRLLAAHYQNGTFSRYSLWYTNPQGKSAYVDEQGRAVKRPFIRSPLQLVPAATVSNNDPQRWYGVAGTPVLAVADGVIESIENEEGSFSVVLRHENGLRSYYDHLAQLAPGLKKGVLLNQQRLLGTIGQDPTRAAWLLFRVERDGVVVDLKSLASGKGILFAQDKAHFEAFSTDLLSILDSVQN